MAVCNSLTLHIATVLPCSFWSPFYLETQVKWIDHCTQGKEKVERSDKCWKRGFEGLSSKGHDDADIRMHRWRSAGIGVWTHNIPSILSQPGIYWFPLQYTAVGTTVSQEEPTATLLTSACTRTARYLAACEPRRYAAKWWKEGAPRNVFY